MVTFGPGAQEECGEGCGRWAVVGIQGLTYCVVCLERLVALGNVFTDAMSEARQQTARIEETGGG